MERSQVSIAIKVLPRAKKTEIAGWINDELVIRLAAQPEKGKANEALLRFIAKALGISLSRVKLVFGAAGRHKRVAVEDLSKEEIRERLASYVI